MAAGVVTPLYPLGASRPLRANVNADVKLVFGTWVFSSSYTSGGESLTPADMGLEEVFWFQATPAVKSAVVGGAVRLEAIGSPVYDYTNEKIIAIAGSAALASAGNLAVEAEDNTDLSGFTIRYVAAGRI